MAAVAVKAMLPKGGGKRRPITSIHSKKSPLAQAVSRSVVNFEEVRLAAAPLYSSAMPREIDDDPPWVVETPPAPKGSSGGDGGGPKELAEWMPRWEFNSEQPALWNLLWNAAMLTPLGRKFRPDTKYSGKGECPPQRHSLHCKIEWDNVVDFETALKEARLVAVRKTANSQHSRGADLIERKVRWYTDRPSAANDSSFADSKPVEIKNFIGDEADPAWNPFTRSWDDGPASNDPAFDESWNDEDEAFYEESTLPGDTGGSSEYMYHCLNFALAFSVRLTETSQDNPIWLSPSTAVYLQGEDEVWLESFNTGDDNVFSRLKRMRDLQFHATLEMADDYFSQSDNIFLEHDMMTDWAVNFLFNLSTVGGEFNSWSDSQLLNLWLQQNHESLVFQRINPVLEGVVVADSPEVSISALKELHHQEMMKHARLKTFNLHKPEQASHAATVGPSINEELRYFRYWDYYQMHDETRYNCWLAENTSPQLSSVRERTGDFAFRLQHTLAFMDSVPVTVERFKDPRSKLSYKLKRWARRVKSWMNEPVLSFGEAKDVAPPIEKFIDEEVERKIVDRVIKDKTAHDDAYDLSWLEHHLTEPIDLNKPFDPVAIAIKAVQDDVPQEEYSETGIYLGKRVMIPRSKGGIIRLDQPLQLDRQPSIPSSILDAR